MKVPHGDGSTEIVGLVPAAGQASRLGRLPCSKEILPVVFGHDEAEAPVPKAVGAYLLEKMGRAGARKAFLVLRHGKWDIPAYFGGGERVGMDLSYLVMRRPWGVPFTLDDAYPFVRGSPVVFGFPDILFQPSDAFESLLGKMEETGAELTLGVFPSRRPDKDDLLDLDTQGRIRGYEVKPGRTSLEHTWIMAAWRPGFTEFLHRFVEAVTPDVEASGGRWRGRELFMGDVVWAAVREGVQVETVLFPGGTYVDIGTPEELALALDPNEGGRSTGERASHQ